MTVFVLDNSVTMRWFFDSGSHSYADSLLHELAAHRDEAMVPILWRYEVSAVLSRAQIKGAISAKDVSEFLDDLSALPITLDVDAGNFILSDVHRIAVAQRLTSYDAAYLELALRRGLPLATLDAELVAACAAAGVTVR